MADLKPEMLTIQVDSREQCAFDVSPMKSVVATLDQGDYSIAGLGENVVSLERKSLPDLLSCIAGERERFERELHRLAAVPHRGVVVECSWADLQNGAWRSRVTPASAVGSVIAWQCRFGVPFMFGGNRAGAEDVAKRFLFLAAKARWRECMALADCVDG